MSARELCKGIVDAELVRRSAAGDREAFSELAERHRARVLRYLSMILPAQDAEDALQHALLAAWSNIGSFRGDSAFSTWLFTIARNAARRRLKGTHTTPRDERSLVELAQAAGWGQDNPETLTARAESARLLHAALLRLAAPLREILVLRDLEGMSGPEAAAVLGLTIPAMKSRLHRARLSLAAALREVDV